MSNPKELSEEQNKEAIGKASQNLPVDKMAAFLDLYDPMLSSRCDE